MTKRTTEPIPPAAPRLASAVTFVPPPAEWTGESPVIATRVGTGRSVRLQPKTALVARDLDGTTTVDDLAELHAEHFTPPQVAAIVRRLADIGMVDDESQALRDPMPRGRTLAGERAVAAITPWAHRLMRPRYMLPFAGGLAAAAVVVLSSWDEFTSRLAQPLDLVDLVACACALLAIAVAHEFAHAALCVRLGGRVAGFGITWFSIVPAPYCDTTDSWRLPPRARVVVALAGVAVNASVALFAAAATVLFDTGPAAPIVAVASGAVTLVNLVPFQKLDGYWALTGALDRPFLRRDAVAAWSRLVWSGQTTAARLPLMAFGAASAASGPLLGFGGLAAVAWLSGWTGPVARLAAAASVALGASVAAHPLRAAMARRATGLPWRRGLAACAALAGVALGAGSVVRVPVPASTPFVRDASGRATLQRMASAEAIAPGDRILLRGNGAVWSPPAYDAVTAVSARGTTTSVDIGRPIGAASGVLTDFSRSEPLLLWPLIVAIGA